MVFDDKSRIMEFPLTPIGRDFWRNSKFLSQDELLVKLDEWWYNPISGITLSNTVCDQYGPQMKQEVWYRTNEIDKFIGDLMDVSLTHGLLFVGNLSQRDNYFAVAETAHHTTNISGEFIEALIRKVEKGNEWLEKHKG